MREAGVDVGNKLILPKVETGLFQVVETKVDQGGGISLKMHHLKHTSGRWNLSCAAFITHIKDLWSIYGHLSYLT